VKKGHVALVLGHDPDVLTKHVRNLTWDEIHRVLNDHVSWASKYGGKHSEEAVQFSQWSKPQIARLKREIKRRLHDADVCPACGMDEYIRPFSPDGPPMCSQHGCSWTGYKWLFECSKCENTDIHKLYGIPTPYVCKTCLNRAPVCSICRQPRPMCCC
jgi:hypothetical protein